MYFLVKININLLTRYIENHYLTRLSLLTCILPDTLRKVFYYKLFTHRYLKTHYLFVIMILRCFTFHIFYYFILRYRLAYTNRPLFVFFFTFTYINFQRYIFYTFFFSFINILFTGDRICTCNF